MRTITLLFFCLSAPAIGGTLVTSTFNSSMEGWGAFNDGTPSFSQTGGNPGGYLRVDDQGLGGIAYFSAGPQYLGNQSAAMGGLLQWDYNTLLTQFFATRVPEVVFVGGGLTIGALSSGPYPPPAQVWQTYSVVLSQASGWRLGWSSTDPLATDAQIQQVLSNVTALYIIAEATGQLDVGGLDNVILTSAPEPSTLLLMTAACALLGYRRLNRILR